MAAIANVGAIGSSAATILGGIITSDDQAKLDKLDRHSKSLVESPLTGDHIDWQNGAVAQKDRVEVQRVARVRMAQLRRDAVLGFESQAVREGWGKKGGVKWTYCKICLDREKCCADFCFLFSD